MISDDLLKLQILENKNIPIISIIISWGIIIWSSIMGDSSNLEMIMKILPYVFTSFLILSYVELHIGAKKFLIFLSIVYIIRIFCYLLYDGFRICSDTTFSCNPFNDTKHPYTIKDVDGKVMKDENGKDIIYYSSIHNLCYDGLLFPACAFALVLIFMNNKNMIVKTLCIIFMISLYILIFYGNKNISYKNINCNEKEKLCYTFVSESLIYALSLISAFMIMK